MCTSSSQFSQFAGETSTNSVFLQSQVTATTLESDLWRPLLSAVFTPSLPGESGWARLWRTYKKQLCYTELSQCVTTGDVRGFLDSKGVSYQNYELPSQLDITPCFTEGHEEGELLLDFLTEVLDFSATASPELKAGVLELLRRPDCSVEADGRVLFNNNLGVIVLDPLES